MALRSRASALARRLIPLLLVGAGLAAYHNSFNGPFIFDDEGRIVENSHIRQLWPLWGVMAHSSRPVVQLSLAVNYALGGLNVWGYHAFNLAVHLLAGLVLFAIVRRTLESERLRARYGQAAPWLALAAAGIWLVHPLQTESVTYIIQRGESLMGLFYLLTLYCGLRGSQSPHPRPWFIAAVSACALGMGSKEVMASAPLLMLLYDRVFLADSFTEIVRRRWGLYLGLAATWGLLGALLATSGLEESTGLTAGLTRRRYAMVQFDVIVHYLRLSLWPHPLILDYYTWQFPGTASAVVRAAVVLALVVGTVLAFRRLPWAGFWGAWFFLILAPTSSIFPLADLAFEHRMYLPLAAVVVLVVLGGDEAIAFLVRWSGATEGFRRWLEVGCLVIVITVLGHATLRRNEDYQTDFALWSDTVAKQPNNPRAHNNLGIALYKEGKIDQAVAHYAEALRLNSEYVEAHNNLGAALISQGRAKEAVPHLETALRLKPSFPEARNNLGAALGRQGRIEEAIAHFSEALRLKPDLVEADYSLGLALAEQGDIRRAVGYFSEAVRLQPHYAEAHNELGNALYRQGQIEEAVAHFAEALRLKPGFTEARNNLSAARASLEQPKDRP